MHLSRNITLPNASQPITCSALATFLEDINDPWDCLNLQRSFADVCGCDPGWVCDPTNDACPFQGDGICRDYYSSSTTSSSRSGTGGGDASSPSLDPDFLCANLQADCFDCDPCAAYSYTSCDACTGGGGDGSNSRGCLWCPQDAICSSIPMAVFPPYFATGSCGTLESDWIAVPESCPANGFSTFDDPLLESQQWVYDLINVEPVWDKGITGHGIRIRINDDGVNASHEEFQGKFDVNASCDWYEPSTPAGVHGTTCASIAAGRANNGACAMGIAYGATLSSCRILGQGEQYALPDALTVHLDMQDISSNSMGYPACARKTVTDSTNRMRRRLQQCPFATGSTDLPCSACSDWSALADDGTADVLDATCQDAIVDYCSSRMNYANDPACVEYLELFTTCRFNGLSDDFQSALLQGVTHGREGKGLIFVYASGNENSYGAYTNFEGLSNTRFTIVVGAVNKNGTIASYSTTGASVMVTGPGGDTDVATNFVTAAAGGGCRHANSGTSFACPLVAGVIALMLEANPNLTWRDVQAILATTSQKVDPNDSSWTDNAAGISHSYKYGFGLINAHDAVISAIDWTNLGNETMQSTKSGTLNLPVDDQGTSVVSTVTVADDVIVESATIYLDVNHSSRGQLEVVLTSPSGTESVLLPGERPESLQVSDKVRWKLLTLRPWGEPGLGDWTLTVTDTEPGDVNNNGRCVDRTFDDDTSLDYDCDRVVQELALIDATVSEACQDEVLADKCCFCGGGVDRSKYQNVLQSWTLILYGRDPDSVSTEPDDGEVPTNAPVTVASLEPTPAASFHTSTPLNGGGGGGDDDDRLEPTQGVPSAASMPTEEDEQPSMVPTNSSMLSTSGDHAYSTMEPTVGDSPEAPVVARPTSGNGESGAVDRPLDEESSSGGAAMTFGPSQLGMLSVAALGGWALVATFG